MENSAPHSPSFRHCVRVQNAPYPQNYSSWHWGKKQITVAFFFLNQNHTSRLTLSCNALPLPVPSLKKTNPKQIFCYRQDHRWVPAWSHLVMCCRQTPGGVAGGWRGGVRWRSQVTGPRVTGPQGAGRMWWVGNKCVDFAAPRWMNAHTFVVKKIEFHCATLTWALNILLGKAQTMISWEIIFDVGNKNWTTLYCSM